MKQPTTLALFLALGFSAWAGPKTMIVPDAPPVSDEEPFADARRPVTNPTLFDLALPTTKLHFIFMNHQFPDQLTLANGARVPFGGDLQLYALQFEYAFNERLSLVALKDGFVDFSPDSTFTPDEGFANVGAGLKYAFLYDPEDEFVWSVTAAYEVPIGSEEVFQGEGDGNLILTTQALKLYGDWQFGGALGLQLPLDDSFSTQGFASGQISYGFNRWFMPFVEANVFTVLSEGDGGTRFDTQVGGAVPAVAPSEGADLLNFGASNSELYATIGFGVQSRLTDNIVAGIAYEIPLTDEEDNITADRLTFDISYTF
ncbi:MAG: hypothetical protein AAF555_06885 [Verrucomicrobiota bacterium]